MADKETKKRIRRVSISDLKEYEILDECPGYRPRYEGDQECIQFMEQELQKVANEHFMRSTNPDFDIELYNEKREVLYEYIIYLLKNSLRILKERIKKYTSELSTRFNKIELMLNVPEKTFKNITNDVPAVFERASQYEFETELALQQMDILFDKLKIYEEYKRAWVNEFQNREPEGITGETSDADTTWAMFF